MTFDSRSTLADDDRGPDAAFVAKPAKSYLLQPWYRQVSIQQIMAASEAEARRLLCAIRWKQDGKQVCPKCGSIDNHYVCASTNGFKCRSKECGAQFSLFAGTRFHGTKLTFREFTLVAFMFAESKNGKSAREMSGLLNKDHQTMHVHCLKMREAIRETMLDEGPLRGYIQADAAYFIKYARPLNKGNGASMGAKKAQREAGLGDEEVEPEEQSKKVSKNMHALVVFVQMGQQGQRRYRIAKVKTETQVVLLELGQRFCDRDSVLLTDTHAGYNFFSGEFADHLKVNHDKEFMTKDGIHTNLAEGIFARLRTSMTGNWHRTSVQYLEEYGWEMAWRQSMVGTDNGHQLMDLLGRLLEPKRSLRFRDYWGRNEAAKAAVPREEPGTVFEAKSADLPKKRGRPMGGLMRKPPKAAAKDKAGPSPA